MSNVLGAVLRKVRSGRDIDRAELARRRNVGASRVRRVEAGGSGNLTWETLEDWLGALGADFYDFADAYYAETEAEPRLPVPARYGEPSSRALRVALEVVAGQLEEARQEAELFERLHPEEYEAIQQEARRLELDEKKGERDGKDRPAEKDAPSS